TFILSLTILSPYIASIHYGDLRPIAPHISTLIGLGLLFTLGLMMGRFSKTDVLKSGIRMVSIGFAAVLLILLIELFAGLAG
ncbi:MAG: hypothetical protein QW801_09750, partial [Candidatus Caldarchaeum sp.]